MSTMFARYVQDKKRRRPLFYAALAVAGVVEGGALGTFLLSSLMHVSEISPPPLVVLLWRAPLSLPLPQLLPRPPSKPPTARPSSHRAAGARLLQPAKNAPPAPPTTAPANLEPGPPDDSDAPPIPGNDPPSNPPAPPLPPPEPPRPPKKVPFFLIKKQQLSGAEPHLPQIIKQQRRGQTVIGTYLICIAKDGHVSDVTTLQGIPGADEEIGQTLRTWLYKEQAIPVCFAQHFEFIVE